MTPFFTDKGKIEVMFRDSARTKIEGELASGEAARSEGFEGRARVCARRAVGAAVREYLDLRGLPVPGASAYDLIAYLQNMPEMPSDVRKSAGYFLTRVDESFNLPAEIDLLAEARRLAQVLEDLAAK